MAADGPTAGSRMYTGTLGSPLLRIGMSEGFELCTGLDGYQLTRNAADRDVITGWSDLSLGAKIRIMGQRGVSPVISLLPSLLLPTGQIASTSSSYDLLFACLESYVSGGAGSGSRPAWVIDVGISRMVGSQMQVDVEAGRRVSPGKPCWFVAAGFSVRTRSRFAH
jgi:hypothetical protein